MKERTAYVIKRIQEWVNGTRIENTTTKLQGRGGNPTRRNNNQEESSRMAPVATSDKKMKKLNASGNGDDEDPNKPVDLSKACEVEFIVKRRRSKPKGKTNTMN